ncbi:MAG TPA: cytochrome c [Acidobacteriaceae bacterium]|nr:cytochrome c [Acidobacteriaceae bacterium]
MKRHKTVLATVAFVGLATCTVLAQSSGADIYKSKCAMCHAADGSASSGVGKMMKVPSFLTPEAKKVSTASYVAIVKDGKGKMPAYGAKLSGPEINSVVAYIRTLQKK